MGIETKSIATLLDEFTTNQIRCWFAQEKNFEVNKRIESGELAADSPEAHRLKAEAADLAQSTNKRRNQLMRAIDAYFEDPNAQLPKSYDSDKPEETKQTSIRRLSPAGVFFSSRPEESLTSLSNAGAEQEPIVLKDYPLKSRQRDETDPKTERILLLETQLQALSDAVLGTGWKGNATHIAQVSQQILGMKP